MDQSPQRSAAQSSAAGISMGISSGDFQWGFPWGFPWLAQPAAWLAGCKAAWHENIIFEANGVGKLQNQLKLAEDGATHLKMALARPKRLWGCPWGQKNQKCSPPYCSLLIHVDVRCLFMHCGKRLGLGCAGGPGYGS